ncbi:MAG: hypothetical protein WCC10_14730 [Tumebacillaceae bacterium]
MVTSNERVALLNAYRHAAQQLVDLFAQGDDLIDIIKLEGLMGERDRLIETWDKLGGGPLNEEEHIVAVEIQQLDRIAMAAMQEKLQHTRERSSGIQMQRRGIAAYTDDYAYDAAFIDKKK